MAVPEGTVQDVLDWVGDDPERAEEALEAERAGRNRSTLITELEAIASEEQEDADMGASADETLPAEGDIEDMAPGPEQPAEITIDANDAGTVIGPVHVRDGDVEVPGGTDLTPGPPEAGPLDAGVGEPAPVEGEQVEYFQAVSGTNGGVLSINGQPFVFSPQMMATLKMAVDKIVAGLSL